jgi:hypothetical protein
MIQKIIEVTSLKNQSVLAKAMSLNSAVITQIKNGSMRFYLHQVNLAAKHFGGNDRDFYEAIRIGDLFSEEELSEPDPKDSADNAKSEEVRKSCGHAYAYSTLEYPPLDTGTIGDKDFSPLPDSKASKPLKSTEGRPTFKDLFERERIQVDEAIHIALLKAGSNSSNGLTKVIFLGILLEKLTDFGLTFSKTEDNLYFQKENRRGFSNISHIPF